MHTRVGVDLDQPDRHVLGQHEISAVKLEAATTPLHVILRREHRQNYGLRHFRINPIVIRFALVPDRSEEKTMAIRSLIYSDKSGFRASLSIFLSLDEGINTQHAHRMRFFYLSSRDIIAV